MPRPFLSEGCLTMASLRNVPICYVNSNDLVKSSKAPFRRPAGS